MSQTLPGSAPTLLTPAKEEADASRVAGRPRQRFAWVLGLIVPVALVWLWATASSRGWIKPTLLPSPGAVAQSAWDFVFGDRRQTLGGVTPFHGAAGEHVSASLTRLAGAYALAVGVGVPLGLGIGLSPLCARLLDPTVQAVRSIPVTAWLPIALVWFGVRDGGAARYLVFMGSVFPIVIATADSAARVPAVLADTARMLGTPRRALARRVYLPAAAPGIVTGLRLGLTLGWMSLIVAETTGTTEGLGAMMFAARDSGHLDHIIVGMITFAIFGLAGDLLLRAVTRPLVAWSDR